MSVGTTKRRFRIKRLEERIAPAAMSKDMVYEKGHWSKAHYSKGHYSHGQYEKGHYSKAHYSKGHYTHK